MELPKSRRTVPRFIWFDSAPSTNQVLRETARDEALPHGTVVATANQTAGRGRLQREWITPPDTALAMSVLVRDFGQGTDGRTASGASVGAGRTPGGGELPLPVSWLPLLAGSAVVAALQPRFAQSRVGVKWPNDVHVRDEDDAEAGRTGQKLCGVLSEMLPDGSVVVGIGVNLLIPEEELPTERATSVLAAGGDVAGAVTLGDPLGRALLDDTIAAITGELLRLVALAESDPRAARTLVLRHSVTLGSEVRVHLPRGEMVDGRARALADDGSLVVDLPTGGQLTVSAGDVEHLR